MLNQSILHKSTNIIKSDLERGYITYFRKLVGRVFQAVLVRTQAGAENTHPGV